ncbi:MAG TPA: hypothetical protein VJW77_07415 [Terriglobia bacterium]|nr:hypothetical protein [Terriglobia bacterium]
MPGSIYFIQNDANLVEMKEQPYDSEDLLQRLLADYVDLLPGDQINSTSPRRWLFISREAPVPSEEAGSGRWAVDHLFLDQEGVPTLVEVKRSTDTRIRREVVGQMLDYAANVKAYWEVESIQEWLEKTCESQGRDSEEAIRELVGKELDTQAFWQAVKTNLQAGRIRLLFVADVIPSELQRIVEFLNEQMDPVEVFAIEIHQFVGENSRVLVPRVIGQSAATPVKGTEWDWERFSKKLEEDSSGEDVAVAKRLLEWGSMHGRFVYWGRGKISGSFVPQMSHGGKYYQFFQVTTGGRVYIPFSALLAKAPFDSLDKRRELRNRINDLPIEEKMAEDQLNKYPSFRLAELRDGSKVNKFLKIYEWFIDQVNKPLSAR